MTMRPIWCFSVPLRSSSCQPRGPYRAATKLYQPPPTLSCTSAPVIRCWAGATLSLVPFFPFFLKGKGRKATPTIPHKLQHLKGSAFQFGTADAAAANGHMGSNVYEVNQWLWQLGRRRPSIWGRSVSEKAERRDLVVRAGAKRSHKTSPCRKAARCGDESQALRWKKCMAWVHLKWLPRITPSQSKIIILTYPTGGSCTSGYLRICMSGHLIPTYPGLSYSTQSIQGYRGISWLAKGVVFSDVRLGNCSASTHLCWTSKFSLPSELIKLACFCKWKSSLKSESYRDQCGPCRPDSAALITWKGFKSFV